MGLSEESLRKFKNSILVVLVLSIFITSAISIDTKVITTTTGDVQGVVEKSSIPGRNVQKFLNIPFAEPPVGTLRFSKPVARKPWTGTLKSSSESIRCLHHMLPNEPKINQTEDCLVLNIWTPYPEKSNLSVMLWIHSGGYIWGDGGSYTGHNFVAVGDVILVTINYRLSALGFLSTGDERIKGNFGLYDQRLAMKWVKENIVNFGGNPDSITIFGESAGGSSASAHTLSPDSWPLFNRAIFQSGVMIMPWSSLTAKKAAIGRQVFLDRFNCSNDVYLLPCLQNISASEMKKVYEMYPSNAETWMQFGPVVDGDFLESAPDVLLRKGQVKSNSVIIGITKEEEFIMLQYLLQMSRDVVFFEKQLESTLNTHFANYSLAVQEKALSLYGSECSKSFLETFKSIVNFRTDLMYLCDAVREADIRTTTLTSSDVYFYQYSYSTIVPPKPFPNFFSYGTFGFAAHTLDVPSTFGYAINDPEYPPDDQIISMRMILYWTNFAKNGDPNIGTTDLPVVINNIKNLPTWPKYTSDTKKYLDMESLSQMVVKTKLREKYCNFLSDPEGYTEKHATTKEPTNSGVIRTILPVTLATALYVAYLYIL